MGEITNVVITSRGAKVIIAITSLDKRLSAVIKLLTAELKI